MRSLLVACVVALSPTVALADWASPQTLGEACKSEDAYLAGYIAGALQNGEAIQAMDKTVGRSIDPTICIPAGVTMKKVSHSFCAFIKAHPERASWPAGTLTYSALSLSYPCK